MSWRIYDERIEVLERRYGFFPRAFRWRGRRYAVQGVDACWLGSRWPWLRRRRRRFFQVACSEGTFELFHDLQAGTWQLRRARLAAPEGTGAWRLLTVPRRG